MKNTAKLFLLAIASAALLPSCEQEPIIFDHPFVYIEDSRGMSSSTVNCAATYTASYPVYLSSKTLNRDVTVDFSVTAGDGLVADTDYRVVTASPITFPDGTFQRFIHIEWFANPIDPAKDNTVSITLTGNSEDFTLGMPGPAHNFRDHLVTKISTE